MESNKSNRRPLKSRQTSWARRLASALARSPVTPDQISLASIGFAGAGALLLLCWPTSPGLVLCALCIQLRLLCNLLDGMVAVEGGKGGIYGALYNEFPDRIADSLFLVALGYAAGHSWLGWLCALVAALTAYIRLAGSSLGFEQDFRGPMGKPHRMAVMTLGCLIAAVECYFRGAVSALLVAGIVIAGGSVWTCATRTRAIAEQLRQRSAM